MLVRTRRARRLLLGSLLSLLPSVAATAPPETPAPAPKAAKEEVIVITGSRIPRPNLTASSPVTVVDSKEVKLEGAVLTESLINALPQVMPDQGAFISNAATGTSTIDLRGLEAVRTLVLINGRRLLPGDPGYPAPDINFIPSSIIKRVEVLTGGASSVYGSDAIAGVVNFILDNRLDGFRVDGQSSFYQHDNRDSAGLRPLLNASGFSYPIGGAVDGGIDDINGAYGLHFGGGRGHLTVYGGYRQLQAVTQLARDYSACSVSATTPDGPLECGGSNTSAEGTFTTRLRTQYRATAARTFVSPPTRFNFAPYNYYMRPSRRYTAGGFADFEISDALQPYAEFMWMNDRTIAQIAPSGDFGTTAQINCDNPLLSAQQLSLVCVNGNFIGQTPVFDRSGNLVAILGSPRNFIDPVTGATYRKAGLRIQRRNMEGGPRQEILTHKDWRAVAGIKGRLTNGLSYDADYVASEVKQSDVHTNDFLTSRIADAIDVITDPATGQPACRVKLTGADPTCVPWDVFALGAVTQAAADALSVPSFLNGTVKQHVATATLTAELEEWGIRSPWSEHGPALNVGAEYRKDQLSLDPDSHYQNADLAGSNEVILPLNGSTSVKELFGELRFPLISHHFIEELTLEAGYRQSWYANAGNKFSDNSYKIAAELEPVRGIRFRASRQRAVRAANIQELFAPVQQSGISADPCDGLNPSASLQECQRTGVTPAQYGNIVENPAEPFEGDQAITGGNPALLPEKATTLALGVVLQPRFLPGFNATIDWFDIKLDGGITTIGGDLIMSTCLATGDPLFCDRIHRDAGGTLWETPQGYVDDRNANVGSFKTNGIDVGASYRRRLGKLGNANFEFNGSWTHRFIIDPGGLATPFDCAGVYGQVCGFPLPRWRHNLRGTWELPGARLSFSLLWRHVSGLPVDEKLAEDLLGITYNAAASEIPAQDYFDATLTYRVGDRYSLRFGVRNLFDREPPVMPGGLFGACGPPLCNGNTVPQLYDPLGRFIFAGATINFKP